MKRKLFTTPVLVALVVSFSGVIAFRYNLMGGPSPVPSELAIASHTIVTPGPHLNPIEEALQNPRRLKPLPPEQIDLETLWLARAIFSETKRVDEQALVAWVVRNRVDTRYRGKRSYEAVVLDPYQFSAFSQGNAKRPYYMGLSIHSKVPGWQTALQIAYSVRFAEGDHRPFSAHTRHFYSERSMARMLAPTWAEGLSPVRINYELVTVDERRFRFYEGVS